MTKSEWSSWVQAIGSIVAIGAGFYFVNRQYSLSRLASKEDRTETRVSETQTLCASISLWQNAMHCCIRAWTVDLKAAGELDIANAQDSAKDISKRASPLWHPPAYGQIWRNAQSHVHLSMTIAQEIHDNCKGNSSLLITVNELKNKIEGIGYHYNKVSEALISLQRFIEEERKMANRKV